MQTRGRSLSTIATVRKPVVLVLAESYLPGYKAGGPVRSISNVVEALGNEVDFRLVTCNRDMGESEPYPGIEPYTWIQVGKAQVIYIPKGPRSLWKFVAILRSTPADLLYLNSFFARRYSILPSILQRMGLLHLGSVVLAPRGEFSAGAVQLKARRKLAYLTIAKRVGLYHGIVWHASSQYEELDIKRVFRDTESIAVASPLGQQLGQKDTLKVVTASDLPEGSVIGVRSTRRNRTKPAGSLRLIFLSRICRMKNLEGAISFLRDLSGQIHLTIYGPAEDLCYWSICQAMIPSLPSNVHVEYAGPVHYDATQDVLAQNDVLLFPTLGENYGHVILEALGAGCPVVISDRTPWRNLEAAGVGWDLPLNDPKKFRDALQACIDMGPEAFAEFSSRAREFVIQNRKESKHLEQNRALFLGSYQTVSKHNYSA